MKKINKPIGYLVQVDLPTGYEALYPFKNGDTVFGEIQFMPGHCVIAGKDGRILWGYHTENFIPLTKDEV